MLRERDDGWMMTCFCYHCLQLSFLTFDRKDRHLWPAASVSAHAAQPAAHLVLIHNVPIENPSAPPAPPTAAAEDT